MALGERRPPPTHDFKNRSQLTAGGTVRWSSYYYHGVFPCNVSVDASRMREQPCYVCITLHYVVSHPVIYRFFLSQCGRPSASAHTSTHVSLLSEEEGGVTRHQRVISYTAHVLYPVVLMLRLIGNP